MAQDKAAPSLARFTRIYPANVSIFREGEPGDHMYFILEGAVRILKNCDSGDAGGDNAQVTLATFGDGDFFGEMSVFTGQSRSGTALTVTRTRLLALTRQEMEEVIKVRPEMALRVIESLCLRLNETDTCLIQEKARHAAASEVRERPEPAEEAVVPGEVPVAGVPEGAGAGTLREGATVGNTVGSTAPSAGYRLVETTCPVCGFTFQVAWVSSRHFQAGKRDSDLRPHYEKENGLYHFIWVCPRCRFAAYRDKFTEVSPEELSILRKMLSLDALVDGNAVRDAARFPDLERAINNYRLAINCYQARRSPAVTMAGLYHQLAWLYREAGEEEKEKKFLRQALEKYAEAYERGKEKFPATLGEPGVLYLVGELNRRLGNYREAMFWLEKVIRHPQIKQHPLISGLARDRWAEVKDLLHAGEGSPVQAYLDGQGGVV